jgi:hypothetical protein
LISSWVSISRLSFGLVIDLIFPVIGALDDG